MSSSSKKIVLKKLNTHNTIWHPESTLVFKSQRDRLVIGRYVNDKIIPLDEEALSLCETWKFKPDESLFDGDEEEPEKVDEEADNEEADEENVDPVVSTVVPKDTVQVSTVVTKESSVLSKNSENSSVTSLLEDITDKFTKQVFAQFNLLEEENTSLKSQLTENETAFAELQKKYDDIKKKFDTMKSLFN